jgi:hypothetical protein
MGPRPMPDDESAVPNELVPGAAALVPKGAAHCGHLVRSHAAAPGKRGGGPKANAKGDAKNGKLFHAETPLNTPST